MFLISGAYRGSCRPVKTHGSQLSGGSVSPSSTHFPETPAKNFSSSVIQQLPGKVSYETSQQGITNCPHCSQSLHQPHFKIHMSKCHGSLMPFTCTLCDRGYETQLGLRRHMDLHEGRKTYCPICNRSFSLSFNLRRHMKLVHGSAQCPSCSAILRADNEYNLHLIHCKSSK